MMETTTGQSYDVKYLENRARELRRSVLELALETDGSHIGGSFSEIEILVSLFDQVLKPEDRFILSKGHACYPYYILLREQGYDPVLCGHPEKDEKNGIHCTTGSLGHGLPIGAGMAYARKEQNIPGDIYVLMSDGECQEGTTWESAGIIPSLNLDNLIVIVDNNNIQALDRVEDVSPLAIGKIFGSFGWYVNDIDGHDYQMIIPALEERHNRPYAIIANTTKGKGVSFIEDSSEWHAKKVDKYIVEAALKELE
jgi:transketolase